MRTRKGTPTLDKKAIRVVILNQLRENHPDFNRLPRKRKREITRAACKAFEKTMKGGEISMPEFSQFERLGLKKIPRGVLTLDEMSRMLENHRRSCCSFKLPSRGNIIQTPLLRVMDDLLDDPFLDQLPAPEGMTPSKRDWMPSRHVRSNSRCHHRH